MKIRYMYMYEYPANTIYWPNFDLMFVYGLGRWPNIKPPLVQLLVFTE